MGNLTLKPVTVGANFDFSRIDSLFFDHFKKQTTAELNFDGNEAGSFEEIINGKNYAIEQTIKPDMLNEVTIKTTGRRYVIKHINFIEKRIFTICGKSLKFSQIEFKLTWNG